MGNVLVLAMTFGHMSRTLKTCFRILAELSNWSMFCSVSMSKLVGIDYSDFVLGLSVL